MKRSSNIFKDFFTTGKGLTSTSANHLANLAKQAYTEDEAFLDSCSFLKTEFAVIGEDKQTVISNGMSKEELYLIKEKLNRIAELKGFCAWLREAIAEKERYINSVSLINLHKWAEENNIELPKQPEKEDYTPAEYNMTIAEKADYLCEEAAASTYGSFIHPGGPGHVAYSELVKRERQPRTVNENGRDTLVRVYTPTVPANEVNLEFDYIRDTWRSHEALVNKQKYENEQADRKNDSDANKSYEIAFKQYNNDMAVIMNQYAEWCKKERERISDLRIIIPNRLMNIYNELRLLGKEK